MPLEVILFAGGGSHNGIFVALTCQVALSKAVIGQRALSPGRQQPHQLATTHLQLTDVLFRPIDGTTQVVDDEFLELIA
jgi:hypothetical protein